jgi:ATP-dependent Clp protease ATP-binding subunit ClpA
VDFSRALIFLTSNLGTREIETLVRPKLGFSPVRTALDRNGTEKISQAGVDAVRRKFSPEFVNRLDKIVVFQPLGQQELRSILALELESIRERIANAAGTRSIKFDVSDAGQNFLLEEGTDERYGARHLKRTVERLLVQPLANLLATGQIQPGDWVRVELDQAALRNRLLFFKKMREPVGKFEEFETVTPQTAVA